MVSSRSYIFISHTSEDEISRIKPIVEILIEEGEPVWIDRPGSGEGCFQFEEAFIACNAIDNLDSGESWSDSIQSAIRHSGAVLGCLSTCDGLEKHERTGRLLGNESIIEKARPSPP